MNEIKIDMDDIAEILGLVELPTEPVHAGEVADAQAMGERVRGLRDGMGMRASVLAERVGLTPDKLSKVENGTRRISVREAPAFADALRVSLRYLLRGDVARPALAMRLLSEDVAGELSPARTRAVEVLEVEERLRRKELLPPLRPSSASAHLRGAAQAFPSPRTKEEAQRQGREFAEVVREHTGLGSAPIGDLPTAIESQFGADVVLGPLGSSVAGLCAQQGDQVLLLANTDFTLGNVRFTLAHELGHYLLGDPREVIEEDDSQLYAHTFVERRVNAFAAHLLLPAVGVSWTCSELGATREDFSSASSTSRVAVGSLMARYGASMACVLHQLRELEWLTWEKLNVLSSAWSARELLQEVSPSTEVDWDLVEITRTVRVPVRMLLAARKGARSGAIGTSTVARLLDREDDDALFEDYVGYAESEVDESMPEQ